MRTDDPSTTLANAEATTVTKRKIYTAEALPEDWDTRHPFRKLEWLATQPLPDDPSVNLAQCYRRAKNLCNLFYVVFCAVYIGRKQFIHIKAHQSAEVDVLDEFVFALNQGLGHFHWELYLDNAYLLKHGCYPENGLKLNSSKLGSDALGIEMILPGLTTLPHDPSQVDKGALVNAIVNISGPDMDWVKFALHIMATLLRSDYSMLQRIRPEMGVSYAQLRESALAAGQKFYDVYHSPELQAKL